MIYKLTNLGSLFSMKSSFNLLHSPLKNKIKTISNNPYKNKRIFACKESNNKNNKKRNNKRKRNKFELVLKKLYK